MFRITNLRAPDGAEGTGAAAPVAVAPPPAAVAAPPPAAPVAAAPSAVPPPAANEPPHYASVREAERRKVLKALGLKPAKGVSADQAIAEAKAKNESNRDRRRTAETALKAEQLKTADLEARVSALKTYADLEMASLDEPTRTMIKAVAGDDPSEQLKQIAATKFFAASKPAAPAAAAPSAAPTPAAPAAVAAAPLAPIPAPAQSAPSQPGPAPGTPAAPIDFIAEIQRLGKSKEPRDQALARVLILQNRDAYAKIADDRNRT